MDYIDFQKFKDFYEKGFISKIYVHHSSQNNYFVVFVDIIAFDYPKTFIARNFAGFNFFSDFSDLLCFFSSSFSTESFLMLPYFIDDSVSYFEIKI